jgi:hypothetical protein
MANNYLEQLVTEWYEYDHFFVRRNVKVGRRPKGGYDCELDVVAFNPENKKLVHIEPSMDAENWDTRERRYKRKFDAGRTHIPGLFNGLDIPTDVEQIALFVFASNKNRKSVGGGKVVHLRDFIGDVFRTLRGKRVGNEMIPESFPILRTLQFTSEYSSFISTSIMDSHAP